MLHVSSNHDYVLHVDLCTIVNTMHFLGTFWPNGEVHCRHGPHAYCRPHLHACIQKECYGVMICRYYAYYAGVMLVSFAVSEHERKAC